MLREKWISIVHHIANIHSWDSADCHHQCAHPPIPRDEARTKWWLRPGLPAHEALKEVLFDKKLLKDIQQLSLCCHTGKLKVYHNVYTKYTPQASTLLLQGHGCPYLANSIRSQRKYGKTTGHCATRGANGGEYQYQVVFPKHTKEWVAKPLMEKTNRDHLKPMLDAIVDRKRQKPQERSATLTSPHIPQNIASKPKPLKADVIAKQTSRFSNF